MTHDLASSLQLQKNTCEVHIGGLNESSTVAKYSVNATIKSRHNNYAKTLEFLVVPSITSLIPDDSIERKNIKIPTNLHLADPEFNIPAPVRLLLGVGATLSTLCVGQIVLSNKGEPDLILQKTQLGWIIGGNLPVYKKQGVNAKCCAINLQEIARFWELEDIPAINHYSKEESQCERHFQENYIRDTDGRYVVALPFKENKNKLGESYHMAMKRLQGLEKRLKKDPELKTNYRKIISDYLGLGYMSKLSERTDEGFYLPHQAVIKESSLTTKLRVVFDASALSNTGLSLNDALMSGPTMQSDIFALLLRFRLHNHVLTGDIEKMYLQIKIKEEDQKYLRILWRDDDGSTSTYQFNRLIFGLKPASYLAIRSLHQLADDEASRYPQAAKILKRDLYVDDLLTGGDTIQEIIQLREELTALLQAGGFHLRQCASNTNAIIDAIPDHNINLQLQEGNNCTLKTLGVHWNSGQDAIIYTVKPPDERRVTKRHIFSEIAKIFDPLGLLNPVIVTAKLIMQELWKIQVDWDESLPEEHHTRWEVFTSQLPALNEVTFDRKMLIENPQEIQLHGFCDASEKAYGACIYLRSINAAGRTQIQLYCAKSRVAPLKTVQTIPRLELAAATLLANLYTTVKASMDINIDKCVFWTDSMITLHWINTAPYLLKTFVANRVADINCKTNASDWRHVRSHDNPADLLSRGILPSEFKGAHLWIKGPSWLSSEEQFWPIQPLNIKPINLPEARKSTCLAVTVDCSILFKYSSYTKLQRIIAICLRLINRKKGLLSANELQSASVKIIQLVQKSEFAAEYDALVKSRDLPAKSKLLNLNPFIDKDGLIRVGGRLHHSSYPYQKKHPIILPKSHHITDLLIKREHLQGLHGGVQSTLYAMRQNYWPLDGKNQVRKIIRKCVRCARFKPLPCNYTMGSLPSVRTVANRPFTNVGVDYCGPFFIKEKRFRNRNKIKVYVAIFVCLSTKATHLEVVSDLTTEGFIAALKRFISRRGKCASIYSDNATNFVGANNELRELHTLLASDDHNNRVHDYLSVKGIIWHFNPPHSPHFGGIWEAAVKSFKHHLRRVVGSELFTFEQFNTLVIEIEAVLNSRPLISLSSDPNDLCALTPSHFLIGDVLSSLPEHNFSSTQNNRLSTWQHIQKVKRDFWTRWHKEYINELNIRHKWTKGNHDIKKDSIVLLHDDNLPPLQWRLGRVIEIYPGHDGIIRTVRVKTTTGELTRTVKKLALLPVETDSSSQCAKDT